MGEVYLLPSFFQTHPTHSMTGPDLTQHCGTHRMMIHRSVDDYSHETREDVLLLDLPPELEALPCSGNGIMIGPDWRMVHVLVLPRQYKT